LWFLFSAFIIFELKERSQVMTSAIFQTENKNDLKLFVALAKRQGIFVRYIKTTPTQPKKETDILGEICGKWKDSKSAEEMIEDIYSARTSGKTRKLVEW